MGSNVSPDFSYHVGPFLIIHQPNSSRPDAEHWTVVVLLHGDV